MKYCIICSEEVFSTVKINSVEVHLNVQREFSIPDREIYFGNFCCGPFASCPPLEELEEDWQDHLAEPTHYEIYTVSSFAAMRLQTDFIGDYYSEAFI